MGELTGLKVRQENQPGNSKVAAAPESFGSRNIPCSYRSSALE